MRRSLSFKLIAGYLIFGILSFLFIALVTARITYYRVLERRAGDLRNMAGLISDMASGSYGKSGGSSYSTFEQLDSLSFYSGLRIWFINPDGMITYDSSSGSKSNLEGSSIPDFDPADTGKPYRTGNFYGVLSDDYLSVSVPMIRNFRTIGYVVIHETTSRLSRTSDALLLLPSFMNVLVCIASPLTGSTRYALPMIAVGASGVISVASDVMPREISDFIRTALAGDMAKARALHLKYYNLFHNLFIDTNPVMVKEALALMGKLDLVYRLPLCETTAANRAVLAETLKELGVLK